MLRVATAQQPNLFCHMGITVSYRGSLDDLDRVEDFEDRVLDLTLELGGQAQLWRTANHDNPRRMVRGLIANLFPGQEPLSLLISPEGLLINLTEIEDAEKGRLDESPWCFVKTQFGPIEGHVALVELLTVLKQEFFSNLEVSDEGEYWETRNLATLTAKMKFLGAAIKEFGKGLQRHGLTAEAAEDQSILLARIERIAQLVHRTLGRPAEHPPVRWDDDDTAFDAIDDQTNWDALYKENRRRQERIQRAIEEHLARGDDYKEAFDAAMLEETALGLPEEPADWDSSDYLAEELETETAEEDEPWRESLEEPSCENDGKEDEFHEHEHHPLQQRAMDFVLRLGKLFGAGPDVVGGHSDVLMHGAAEMMGGLAQAIGSGDRQPLLGLSVVQLKRAMRGAAFAQGSLFPLRTDGTLDKATFEELHETIDGFQTDIFAELSRLRQQRETGC